MLSDSKVAKLFTKQRETSNRGLGSQYNNTEAARSFYDGDMMTYQDKIQFESLSGARKRATVQFNKVQPSVDAVGGFMAQNRRQAKFMARINSAQSQQIYSRNMNALYSYHRENTNADQLESEQDWSMLIEGYGAIETDLSYIIGNATSAPNGEILKCKLDGRRVYWDPNARAKNLLDARWCGYFEDYDLKEALELFQGSKPEDFQSVDDDDMDSDDQGYQYNPWGGLYDKIKLVDNVEWTAKDQDQVRVYNHQWFEYQTFYRAKNPVYLADNPVDAIYYQQRLQLISDEEKDSDYQDYPAGLDGRDLFDFDPMAEELVFTDKIKSRLVKEFGDLVKPVGFKRKCYYTTVISGEHVFTRFKSVSQQGFSVKFKTGIFNETEKIWIGMVNSMMEPAKYYNKSLTELMFTIAANSKGGVMLEESAVEDVAEFEKKWAKTDGVIVVRDGAISGATIQEKARGAVPTGLENIIQLSAQAVNENGVDPSVVGQIDNEAQSGIFYKRRIRQAISKMAIYFDSTTLYQKEDARLCADLIRVWLQNNNGEVIRITGEEGFDEFVSVTEDMVAAEYDVSIQEASQTPEDRQELSGLLSTKAQFLASIGANEAASTFESEALQLLPLDGDVRNRLIQSLQPKDQQEDPQVAQLKALVQQLQDKITTAQTDKLISETQLNLAKLEETKANTNTKDAAVIKTMAETERTDLENQQLKAGNFQQPSVSI